VGSPTYRFEACTHHQVSSSWQRGTSYTDKNGGCTGCCIHGKTMTCVSKSPTVSAWNQRRRKRSPPAIPMWSPTMVLSRRAPFSLVKSDGFTSIPEAMGDPTSVCFLSCYQTTSYSFRVGRIHAESWSQFGISRCVCSSPHTHTLGDNPKQLLCAFGLPCKQVTSKCNYAIDNCSSRSKSVI
jgi:hypothetical protein